MKADEIKHNELKGFIEKNPSIELIDEYEHLLYELFLVRNPKYKFLKEHNAELGAFKESQRAGKEARECGKWFYFKWSNKLCHFFDEDEHLELRTARNKNIITKSEQDAFYGLKVAVAGLSVGSHAALTTVLMGGAGKIKLADPDTISGTNLNRIRYDYTFVEKHKAVVAAEIILQVNPYNKVELYTDGVSKDNADEFLEGVDLLVEEMDNLEMKILLRLKAREKGIPVVMATDNGDNVIVDIERFDLDRNLKIFNGAIGNITLEEFQKIPPQEMPRLATKIAGPKVVVPRMLTSLLEVGKTLYSWPQLGDAATLSGVAVAYIAKRLALKEKIRTGKLEINLDRIFDPDYDTQQSINEREAVRASFMKTIGLE